MPLSACSIFLPCGRPAVKPQALWASGVLRHAFAAGVGTTYPVRLSRGHYWMVRALPKTGCLYRHGAEAEAAHKQKKKCRCQPTLPYIKRHRALRVSKRARAFVFGRRDFLYEPRYRSNPTCTHVVCHRSSVNARTNRADMGFFARLGKLRRRRRGAALGVRFARPACPEDVHFRDGTPSVVQLRYNPGCGEERCG